MGTGIGLTPFFIQNVLRQWALGSKCFAVFRFENYAGDINVNEVIESLPITSKQIPIYRYPDVCVLELVRNCDDAEARLEIITKPFTTINMESFQNLFRFYVV